MKNFESAVFFGKGGIGKSTIASNFSALLGAAGRKVLHVGCDPKLDSTLSLAGRHIAPFGDSGGPEAGARLREFIQPAAVPGVHCVEAGGPRAGLGCAGAGIGALLDAIKDSGVLVADGYEAAVFDVLGDVVCGGFAAPLRRGFARKVVIVTSEEPLSLYSANRLIQMTGNFARNGVWLAGLAVNCRGASPALALDYAAAVNARVLAVLPRDPAVGKAERRRVPAALAYPKTPFAAAASGLAAAILAARPAGTPPRALSDAEFGAFIAGRAAPSAPAPASLPALRGGVAEAFRRAGLRPAALEGGQIVCDWSVPGGTRRVVLAPAGPNTAGRLLVSDWAACIHPSSDERAAGRETVKDAAAPLAGFAFADLLAYFGGAAQAVPAVPAPARPRQAAVRWQPFIFPSGNDGVSLPPDLAVAEHGDAECRFCEVSAGRLSQAGGGSLPGLPKAAGNVFSTGFGSRDALAGEGPLVRRALEAAARSAGRGGLVEFYTTCGPMLLAGDTAAAADDAEREHGVRVLRENFNSYDEYSAAKTEARAALLYRGLCRARRARRRPAYDLAFHGPRPDGELSETLAAGGLRTAPAAGFYENLAAARLVILPARDAALCPALDRAGIKWLAAPEPLGFAATRTWYSSIFKALGRPLPAGARPAAGQRRALAALAAEASAFEAALVAEAASLPALAGMDFLPPLAESGLRLRLLVRLDSTGRAAAEQAAEQLRKTLRLSGLKTHFFSGSEELAGLLAGQASLRLVYSDLPMDPRVLAAGKNPFSRALFEPGYGGAVESARRLLELCRWDFSRRYLAGGL